MQHDTTTVYKWISGILALALIIGAFAWFVSQDDFEEVTDDLSSELVDYREEIDEVCRTTATSTAIQKEECLDTLRELNEILAEYSVKIDEVQDTAPSSTATTTP